jgi:hypothetical protein
VRPIALNRKNALFAGHDAGSVDLIMPSMDHWVAVEVVDEFKNALLELVLGGDADVTEYGAGGDECGDQAVDRAYADRGSRSLIRSIDHREVHIGSWGQPSPKEAVLSRYRARAGDAARTICNPSRAAEARRQPVKPHRASRTRR